MAITPTMCRVIFHLDMDAFYASIEQMSIDEAYLAAIPQTAWDHGGARLPSKRFVWNASARSSGLTTTT
jgi:nucleotidyltransferase/DNA polymerase involved in DNA repair